MKKLLMTTKNRVYLVLKFIGRRGLTWLGINLVSGFLLGFAEIAVGTFLAVILYSLGISDKLPLPESAQFVMDLSTPTMLTAFLLIGVFRSILNVLVSHSTSVATNAINLRLQMLALFDAFKIKQGAISTGKVFSSLNDFIPRSTSFCHHTVSIAVASAQALIMVTFMWKLSKVYLLIGFVGVFIAAVLVFLGNQFVRKTVRSLPDANVHITTSIKRSVQNLLLLRALRTLDIERQRLNLKIVSAAGVQLRALFLARLIGVFPQIVGTVVVCGLIAFHLYQPDATGIVLVSFLYIFVRLVQSLGGIADNFGQMSLNYPYFKSNVQFYKQFPSQHLHEALLPVRYLKAFGSSDLIPFHDNSPPEKMTISAPPPKVVFENVVFSYEGSSKEVLSGLSFTVQPGHQIAIVGQSGKGKSTILGLALGILKPKNGKILLDDLTPDECAAKANFRIGYVGAEPFLIEGTVAENLSYGLKYKPDQESMLEAMHLARLSDWLNQNSLDYLISESGEGLSSGQKQRLSLARAFLAKPSLLILDEVSANLDVETESEVAKVIQSFQGRCTTLIVSHRKGLIKDVEQILELT